ncbi:uncharacterized protein LOC121374809 [Gigantopelta aegis]|uniref:uncharacterized protein LOC121374809 n=1 Tax=Gigantopelta aegis TaxID=1735272 RepID=UPI001B88CF96|nr:uncharacterized protein LOC121374809 [Gigantopelta aegis]
MGFLHFEPEKCPKKLGIGDKWYDGYNWCICTDFGPSCTKEIASMRKDVVAACENVGEKWIDGCYRCRCRQKDIVCHADVQCVHGLRDFPVDCGLHSGCICGLDGVPSCIKDVLAKQKALNERWIVQHTRPSKLTEILLDKKDDCKLGTRWYDGSDRCFCDSTGDVTCGDPKHVAQRIDGFRFKSILCPSRLVWEYNCKRCTCHVSGIAFCVRIHHCTRSKSLVDMELHKNECEVGSEWDEGCRRCRCDDKANIVCDDSNCNQSGSDKTKVKVTDGGTNLNGGDKLDNTLTDFKLHVQVPPALENFIRRKGEEPKMCGKYKPGEKYWEKCNLCYCTEAGDALCTAMMCR